MVTTSMIRLLHRINKQHLWRVVVVLVHVNNLIDLYIVLDWLCHVGALCRAERVDTLFNGLVVLVLVQHGQVLREEQALFQGLLLLFWIVEAIFDHVINFLGYDWFVLVRFFLEVVALAFELLVERLLWSVVHGVLTLDGVADDWTHDFILALLLVVHLDEWIHLAKSQLGKTCQRLWPILFRVGPVLIRVRPILGRLSNFLLI